MARSMPFSFLRKATAPVAEDRPADDAWTRHVARLLEASGAGRMATVDIHNPSAFDNAFRIPAMNIMPVSLAEAELPS